jgi:type I restriction enzyme S subunit
MPKKSIALSDWATSESLVSNKFAFTAGDILFGKLRPYFHKVGVAPVDGVCSTDVLVIRPKQEWWSGFVLSHASSEEMVEYANAGSTGTKMPRTSWSELCKFKIHIPPFILVQEFNATVFPLISRIQSNVLESRNIASLRDILLPRLISGHAVSVQGLQAMENVL